MIYILLVCQFDPQNTLFSCSEHPFLLPLQAAQSSEKRTGRGTARVGWCDIRRLKISVVSSPDFTLTHAMSWEESGPEHCLWGPTDMGLNPGPDTY